MYKLTKRATVASCVIVRHRATQRDYTMPDSLKDAIDVLIDEGEWSALDALCKHFGGDVFDYVWAHEDCPWK
jgi:Rieske Fe-S protein